MNESYNKGISIIICCYNSAKRLPSTLSYIARLEVEGFINWEVILVDNNSTDGTSFIAEQEWKKYNLDISFKIVNEAKQGLSYARRAGASLATQEFLLFCDDDNWLEKNYINVAYEIMNQNSNIGVLGGFSIPFFDIEPPIWFSEFQNAYALGKQMPQTGLANKRRYIAGAGMVIRKEIFSLLEKVSFYNILPDRQGERLTSGGDSELCLIILFFGYDLYYDERLKFVHYIPESRLEWKYCVDMISQAHGIPQIYFRFYKLLYVSCQSKKSLSFEEAYRITFIDILKTATRNFLTFKKILKTAEALAIPKIGSRKFIEVKSYFKKIQYLILNKKKLKNTFEIMSVLIGKVVIENQSIHNSLRECFLSDY